MAEATTAAHRAVLGMTLMGKTWRLKRLVTQWLRWKQQVIVWSGVSDREWPGGALYTESPDELESWLNDPERYSSFIVLDEASNLFMETKEATHPRIWRLAKEGRHYGFSAYFATQFPTGIPKRVRTNIAEADVFKLQNEDYAREIVGDFGLPKAFVERILSLEPLHYWKIRPAEEPVLYTLA